MKRHLHIVCLDVPWPADYGGAIDMFYKIKAFFDAGIAIHLHYFSYNDRGTPDELIPYCESINVYERKTGYQGFSFKIPYIVSSRINEELIANLNKNDFPILLEGIHCTGILSKLDHTHRTIIIRVHNRECEYYRQMGSSTSDMVKKIYFHHESVLLKKYESTLPVNCHYACITDSDAKDFRDHGFANSFFLPAFTPYDEIRSQEGMGNFCLYHGNLSVPENEKAAVWLVSNVFPALKIPLVIAGKNPSKKMDKIAHLCQHTCLVADPSETEITDLVRKAHINILPSFSTTGIKIKLLHALFEGRHCIANAAMVSGTGLEEACHIGGNAVGFASIVSQLHHMPFAKEEITLRKRLLGNTYDNKKNVQKLIQYLW